MEGWIKVYRKLIDNPLWHSERFTRSQAWIDLLLLANHKPNIVFIRGNEVKTERGDLCYSIVSLSKRWCWNERTVNKFISWLENQEMIQSRKNNITTIISIKNYDSYQGSTEQSTEQSTEPIQSRVQTNKNDKNVKNEKNSKNFVIPSFEELKKYAEEIQYLTFNPDAFINWYEATGWMIGKNKMKSWKAAVRTWKARTFISPGNNGNGKSGNNETLILTSEN
jgi:hypothetical protein